MEESFFEIISGNFKKIIPLILSLFLVLINFIPVHIPLTHFLRPDLAIISVYFWVLYRPDLFGPVSTLILGLFVDFLSASPLGLHVFVLMSMYVLIVTLAGYVNTKPFITSWVGFGIICFIALFLKWVLLSCYTHHLISMAYIVITYFVTVLIYPLFARFDIYIQNKFLSVDEAIDEQG